MLRVGIVGIGFMGMIHYLAYQKTRGAKVVALASRDAKKRAGDWRGIKGNFGPPGEQMDLQGIATHGRWQDLLADPSIDVVDICLPPSQHAEVALAAFKAGKHVFCEKPISVSTADADRMVAAATKAGKQLLIGHVLPFNPEFAYVLKSKTSGKYGALLGGQFKRIIAVPTWNNDFFDPDKVGGPVVDLHIHDAHFIRLMFGMPTSVFTTGRMRGEVAEFFTSQFQFADPSLVVSAISGVIPQQGRSFAHGFEVYFEKATLVFDFSVLQDVPTPSIPLMAILKNGKVEQVKLPTIDPFVAEMTEVVRSISRDEPSEMLSGQLAAEALRMCHKQTQSIQKNKAVRI